MQIVLLNVCKTFEELGKIKTFDCFSQCYIFQSFVKCMTEIEDLLCPSNISQITEVSL